VLVAAGDLAGARGRYEEALAVDTKLAKDNPASAEAQRDLSVSYTKLGDVALEGGNHAHAADFYRKSLLIMEPLVLRDKSNAAADRSIMAIYLRMGKATGERTWLEKALQVLEKLEEERRIFPADRETLEALRKTLKGQE
jgi:tetratricopeptide (TPR) repeat protein